MWTVKLYLVALSAGLAYSASVLDVDFNKDGPHIGLKSGGEGDGDGKDGVSILAPVFNFDMRKGVNVYYAHIVREELRYALHIGRYDLHRVRHKNPTGRYSDS